MYKPNNFTLQELCRSAVARLKKIDNTPSFEAVEKLSYLCEHALDPLREAWKKPLIISSAFRSVGLNRALRGSKTSQHMCLGPWSAADIQCEDMGELEALEAMAAKVLNDFDQLIIEKRSVEKGCIYWLHIGLRLDELNRRERLRIIR